MARRKSPRRTPEITLAPLIAALVVASGAIAAPIGSPSIDVAVPRGSTVALPDLRRLNFRCMGAGAPTVILESGFGASSLAWSKVQPLIAARHKVCSYDRAGYGGSDPGPLPRDGAAVARDLDEGLRAAGLRGPLIMVGHSAGGLYVRLFAARRPREVVGMVLVDPSVAHQDAVLSAAFGAGAGSLAPLRQRAERCLDAAEHGRIRSEDPSVVQCLPPPTTPLSRSARETRVAEAAKPATWKAQIAELDTLWSQTSDEVEAIGPGGRDTPLIVLTADGDDPGGPSGAGAPLLRFWRGLHQKIAATSTAGEERLIRGSSHMMMNDRPDAIVDAIEDVTSRAAERTLPHRRNG